MRIRDGVSGTTGFDPGVLVGRAPTAARRHLGAVAAGRDRPATPRRIVVGFDGTRGARGAVDQALALAAAPGQWELVLVCTHERPADFSKHTFLGVPVGDRVWPGLTVPAGAWLAEWDHRVQADLEHEAKRVRLAGVDARTVCTRDDPAELLSDVANEIGAEHVVLYEKRHGWLYDFVLGSMAGRVARRSDIPVLVVSEERTQAVAA